MIGVSGTRRPIHVVRLWYPSLLLSLAFQVHAPLAKWVQGTRGVVGCLSELTTSLSSPEVVANDWRKWEAPPDPSSQAMVSISAPLPCVSGTSTTG